MVQNLLMGRFAYRGIPFTKLQVGDNASTPKREYIFEYWQDNILHH